MTHDGRAVYLSRRKKGSTVRDNELIRIDLATGAIRQVGLILRGLGNTQVHPSGKKIYFQAGDFKQEIWIAENIIPSR